MVYSGEGQVVKIVCATPRMAPKVLDGILEISKTAPSMGFNGNPTENPGEYAYYLFPPTTEFYEFVDKAAEIEGVIRAEVVETSEMNRY